MGNLSREEFSEVLDLILAELSGLGLTVGEVAAGESLPLRTEIDNALALFRDPHLPRGRVVGLSVGLTDSFTRARWDELLDELYAAYVARKRG